MQTLKKMFHVKQFVPHKYKNVSRETILKRKRSVSRETI